MRDWFSLESALIVGPASGTGASSSPCRIDAPGCPTGRVTFFGLASSCSAADVCGSETLLHARHVPMRSTRHFPALTCYCELIAIRIGDEVGDFRDLAVGGRIGEIRRGGVRWLYFLGTAASWRGW